MSSSPRIALIHATPIAMEPIHQAFGANWPAAEAINILEESLSPDRAREPELTTDLAERIVELARYARKTRADGILFTCSAFGTAIEQAAKVVDVPVLKPNEAMFEASIGEGSNIAMIATFGPAVQGMEAEFAEEAKRLGKGARLTTIVAEGAIAALRAGDEETHNRLVAESAAALKGFDAIVLAHFSTSRAASAVRAVTTTPVFTSPDAAVKKMRRLIASA
ncbi:aspartate/glutamate racemase family protein [Bradyrhizobium sp. STM 3557]|uniref:aspartate/glutamate racemase family protein n=1 Tax=Bradyrhizobium sp. STM 3557 TaxID=578920 RepID=UPI0038909E3E